MKKIIILDFGMAEVHVYGYTADEDAEQEEIVEILGHKSTDCQWMIVETLEIKIH